MTIGPPDRLILRASAKGRHAAATGNTVKLVQLLLPRFANDGRPFSEELFREVRSELTDRFGGLTAFTRSPAEGLWKSEGRTHHDEIIVFEVMTDTMSRAWWRSYRATLEGRFQQDQVVIRVQDIEII
jgi:hypothetical protein